MLNKHLPVTAELLAYFANLYKDATGMDPTPIVWRGIAIALIAFWSAVVWLVVT